MPEGPGVYLFFDSDQKIIYVGKAKNLRNRVSSYFNQPPRCHKVVHIQSRAKLFELRLALDERAAFILENQLIKKHQPMLNMLLKDDKSYPYITITDHAFPRLMMTRKPSSKGRFYGPYTQVAAVKQTIDQLQRLFKIRSCRDYFFKNRSRPCLQYQINRCSAPCVGKISPDAYHIEIKKVDLFLRGQATDLLDDLQQKMDDAAKALNYELAALLRDQIKQLHHIHAQSMVKFDQTCEDYLAWCVRDGVLFVYHARVLAGAQVEAEQYQLEVDLCLSEEELLLQFLNQLYQTIEHEQHRIYITPNVDFTPDTLKFFQAIHPALSFMQGNREAHQRWLTNVNDNLALMIETHQRDQYKQMQLHALLSKLGLNSQDCRIECYDISHHQGRFTAASCVVFDANGPIKAEYRKYNLSLATPGDDYEAMYQVIQRRFSKLQTLPDLILIDGGKGQVNQCVNALLACDHINFSVIGIAKGPARKVGLEQFFEYQDGEIALISLDPELKQYFLWIRDEAHRFAITHTRKQLTQQTVLSQLEHIEGVGVLKRRALLQYFGGWQALEQATEKQIARAPGIGPKLAAKIHQAIHRN